MERIRQLRTKRGLSQAKLAVRADMDPATLNRLEQGKGNPNLRTLERVADALEIEVADLFPKAQAPLPLEEAGLAGSTPVVTADLTSAAIAVPAEAMADAQEEATHAALGLSERDLDDIVAVFRGREEEYRAALEKPSEAEGVELDAARKRYALALEALVERRAVGGRVGPVLRQALPEALRVAEGGRRTSSEESRTG